jgi:gas vesicle protein
MDDDKRFSYFFLGLGVGAALGILFAPKSGEETREYLRSRAGEGADYLKRRGDELREQAGDILDRGKDAVKRQKEHLAAAVDAGRVAYRDATHSPGRAAAAAEDLIEGV